MGKIAFVFSGQGAQYAGMGKSLYDLDGAAKELFRAAEYYRPGTMKQCFFGSDAELKETANTQPCLYLVSLSAALSLEEKGIQADGVAGFSLGEVTALAYAKAYSYTDGFQIVTSRGTFMQEAAQIADTAMCAVVRLDSAVIAKTAAQFEKLYAVNYNCPGQTVVSGLKRSMPAFAEEIKALGGKTIPLAVSAAFHSPFMEPAAEKFGSELTKFSLRQPQIPVYANKTAMPYTSAVRETLQAQMKSAVQWQKTVENMIADGYTDFIEVGPGKTLCGLIRKTSKTARVYSVENAETLNETVQAVKENA